MLHLFHVKKRKSGLTQVSIPGQTPPTHSQCTHHLPGLCVYTYPLDWMPRSINLPCTFEKLVSILEFFSILFLVWREYNHLTENKETRDKFLFLFSPYSYAYSFCKYREFCWLISFTTAALSEPQRLWALEFTNDRVAPMGLLRRQCTRVDTALLSPSPSQHKVPLTSTRCQEKTESPPWV